MSRLPFEIDSEFIFGGVPCLVVSTTGARPTARVYVIDEEGDAIRPLVDRAGKPFEFTGPASDDVLQDAVNYLETRFGTRGPACHWGQTRNQFHTWRVLHDSPVRPGDDCRSLVR